MLIIESFPKIPRAQHETSRAFSRYQELNMKHWRSHCDWTKQNKAKLAHYFECDLDAGPHTVTHLKVWMKKLALKWYLHFSFPSHP
jgi:hypothetical protein